MKKKIAVIGGGVGAVTAIYALTQTPDWQTKYSITVYQMGWRLGGKGASGRQMDAGGRILEHGLHVWAGFYENAFRNMRACYDQLNTLGLRDPAAPLGTMDAAFKPLNHLFLSEDVDQEWRPWVIDLPPNKDVPGTGTKVPSPFEMFKRMLEIGLEFLKDDQFEGALAGLLKSHSALVDQTKSLPSDAGSHIPSHRTNLGSLIQEVQSKVKALETPENLQNDGLRRLLLLMDVSLAYAHGMVCSDAFVKGYDALDQWEFSAWLRANGASDWALNSVLLRGCYDFVFGYSAGDTHHGNVGAGTAIRAMSRMLLTYKGAVFFKMQAGMGDTIFAPYYQVLSKLGVEFKYFNAARRLCLNDAQTEISAIEMVEQAVTKQAYDPLVDVQDLPCWPSEPNWDQLVDGAALKASGVNYESEANPPSGRPYTLTQGDDFDHVILGASIGSLGYLSQELREASPRWARMLDSVKTVGTQAAQFWLKKDSEALGWDGVVAEHNPVAAIPEAPMQTVLTGFAEPLDTWADMSHLLPRENWAKGEEPASLAYFCAPAPDGQTLENFQTEAENWAATSLTKFWPKALKKNGGFATKLLCSTPQNKGFKAQYFRVNMTGSERYVLSVPNSLYHRLAPDESGFENLTLAGDWTRCGLNAGCVEAATMSGIAAASAVSGVPLLNVGADDISETASIQDEAMYQTSSISGTRWPLTPFFARGEMNGWFMFYTLPRDQVAALLPEGLHLGHCANVPAGMHSVGLSFCRYQNVRGSFVPNFLSMSPYGEATYAIPYVQSDEGGRSDLLYPRKLYVNSSAAIMAGKLFYAMNKSKAEIDVLDTSFTANDKQGLKIDAQFEQHSDPVAASQHPAQGAISSLLNQSFITRRDSGKLLYNAFNLELDRAYIAPASGKVSVEDPSSGGFAPTAQTFAPLGNDAPTGLPGAFRIWCSWSMTNPLDSKRVRHAAKARSWLMRTY